MILSIPLVLIYLLIGFLQVIVVILGLSFAVKIYRQWNFSSYSENQYSLERRNYLVSSLTQLAVITKFLSFPFFIYIVDYLSSLITGAMCAAGIFGAVYFSDALLAADLLVLYFGMLWIFINREDILSRRYLFTRLKLKIFFVFSFFVFAEYFLLVRFFSKLNLDIIVKCCGLIYSPYQNIFSTTRGTTALWPVLLYLVIVILIMIFERRYKDWFSQLYGIIFLGFSFFMVTHFFAPYIYELPSHHCPYCLLKPEYKYIGYMIYFFMIGGAFSGMVAPLVRILTGRDYRVLSRAGTYMKGVYLLLVFYYPLSYYLRNGVLL